MTALTVGVTTSHDPACKRGLAVNLAASLARDSERALRVCVVDADPLNLDVTTRLAVRGPLLEDFAERCVPDASALGSVHEPPLWVLPSAGAGVGLTGRSIDRAVGVLAEDFDIVICDLVGGPTGPMLAGSRLDHFDWLLLAVTPEPEPVDDAEAFVRHFEAARDHGDIAERVRLGVVTTGDESSVGLTPDAVAGAFAEVVGSIPQLWGRSVPNLGFGAALGIAELDDAVAALFDRLGPVGCESSRAS